MPNHRPDTPSPNSTTWKKLLAAADEEFSRQGYFRFNVDRMTKAAKVSYGSFYLYFKNKNDVLIHLLDERLLPFDRYIGNKRSWLNVDRAKYLKRTIHNFFEHNAAFKGLFKAYAQGAVQSQEVSQHYQAGLQRTSQLFLPKIRSLKRSGVFSGCNDKVIALFLATSLVMPYFLYSMSIIQCSQEDIAENLSKFLFSILNFDTHLGSPTKKKSSLLNKTRRTLIKEAQILFAENGYFETNVADIVKSAGYSRGTFYQYFKDKDDLLLNIYQDLTASLNPFREISHGHIDRFDFTDLDCFIRLNQNVYDLFESAGPLKWSFIQGLYFSEQLSGVSRSTLDDISAPVVDKIGRIQGEGRCVGVDPTVITAIILTTIGFMAFMATSGIIDCSKKEFAMSASRLLHAFFNYTPA
ncbi:MAG: TetR/AcrR family transcriptional regulator [Proteobacteria bacterium]|nr:TetR/AcrR family transcriptional regulator [Pseudomonadota bacterium]